MKWTKNWILALFLSIVATKGNCQRNVTANISQYGLLNFTIIKSNFFIYLSPSGQIISFSATGDGGVSYDFKGRVDKIGITSISYDFKGRIGGLGNASISYDFKGRIEKIGNIAITYDCKDMIDKIDNLSLKYDFRGRLDKIGNSTITYDFKGRIGNIDDTDGIFILRSIMEN